jgi:uncharacterized damage-inducible protein DinB
MIQPPPSETRYTDRGRSCAACVSAGRTAVTGDPEGWARSARYSAGWPGYDETGGHPSRPCVPRRRADNDGMPVPFPSPTVPAGERAEVFLRYLDYFREAVVVKVLTLPDDELRRSRLPSAWSPLELLKHLRYVELRWIEWGFQGREVDDPWGDQRADRWYVEPEETRADLIAALREQGEHTRRVVQDNDLTAPGAPGPRWDGADPTSLERVLFHLLQEYARHLGHLDIVVELATGSTAE